MQRTVAVAVKLPVTAWLTASILNESTPRPTESICRKGSSRSMVSPLGMNMLPCRGRGENHKSLCINSRIIT